MPPVPVIAEPIVITASRLPEAQQASPASATIIDAAKIERLGEPLLPALLRIAPSVAVTTQGPSGLLTEVRIRGAENNHTLLFIDGIRANDPATGGFARFEILNADLASRIEVVRGPQSALWGSEAIGGVIAVNGVTEQPGFSAAAEAGAFGLLRSRAAAAFKGGSASIAGAVGWQRATGIDSFSGGSRGDEDGYRNLSGRVRADVALAPAARIVAAAFAFTGRSEFDGYDDVTFERTDTRDFSRNRLAAGGVWLDLGAAALPWSGKMGVSVLRSSNRNLRAGDPQNRTSGTRHVLEAQVQRRFATGDLDHRLVLAGEADQETFHARDTAFGGFTNQDRKRSHRALTLEWRASAKGLTAGAAVRRDMFDRFADATSLRFSLLREIGGGFALAGSYTEGIAQPTFFDLYGFFPNNFIGNPSLRPESSRGMEGSVRYRRSSFAASITGFRQRLHDEIVDTFDPATFLSSSENRTGTSRRWGVEVEAAWQPLSSLRLSAGYAYLDATQPGSAPDRRLQELRRPRHSGSLTLDGASGPWSYAATLAFSGSRLDREEVFPFGTVRLDAYWLASARLAYGIGRRGELFVRGSNLLDQRYEESAGYRTEGRGIFVGVRLADRQSSR